MRFNAVLDVLAGDAGAYATYLPPWVNALCGALDYGWFAALLGWTLVLMGWWGVGRHSAAPAWRWLPWSAAASLLTTGVTFFDLTTARLGGSPREAFTAGDRALTFIAFFMIAGWWLQFGRHRSLVARIACAVLAAIPLGLFGWFASLPPSHTLELPMIGWLMLGFGLAAAVPWWFANSANGWSRAAVTLAALAPLFSTIGPLSRRVLFMSERFSPLTPLSLASAIFQCLVAAITLTGLVRAAQHDRPREARRKLWREARPFVFGAIACVMLGLFAAGWIGGRQRESANERALDQARLAVTQIDPEMIAAMVGPEFRFVPPQGGAIPYFPPTRLAFSPFLANGGDGPTKRALLPIARASRTMTHLRFVTLREGWVVGLAGYASPSMGSLAHYFGATSLDPATPLRQRSFGYLLLARRVAADDLIAWSRKSEWLEGPITTPVFTSPAIFARVPVVTRDRRMLGWLEFTYPSDAFLAETIQARVAPFVGATLGVMLTAMLLVQRRQASGRDAARREAAVAAEAARMKTDFLAKVSHELRTPLQGLLGYGELLQADLSGAAAQGRLAALRQNGELMLRLVNDLLDLSAVEAGGFRLVEKPTALAALVRETIESLRPRAEAKGLALTCRVAPDFPPWVAADGERIRQIVLNLAGNALKFTDRGRVEIDLRVAGWAVDDTCGIELAVRDTGPGIALEAQPRLFQPFSRLELTAKKEGTGLGLALSSALCRSHGGELTVESDGHTGSCFCARFKLRLAVPPIVEAPAAFPSLQGRRVLIADDNPLVRDLFVAWLTGLGASCASADDGAVAVARASAEVFDAVILDLAMPQLDGLAAARRLRAMGRSGRIVGVSAHASGGDRAQALAAGMDAFLTKPVELHALAAALVAAPVPVTELAADKYAPLRAQLSARFRDEVAGNAAAIREALGRRDWMALHQRVHYLKNSAGVVGDERLYGVCGAVEDAAEVGDAAAAEAAWATCESTLASWLT